MNNFHETNLKTEIIAAIDELGFETPTPIQKKSIPQLLTSSQDLIATAHTGTGKTAAFSLPILDQIDTQSKETQALILAPTRELCIQIANDIKSFAKNLKGFREVAVYGGASIENQIKDLKKGAHIIIGTPGRTLDLIKRKKINLTTVQKVVLDEADEMLSMGFQKELNAILAAVPETRQTILFSATMPKEIVKLAQEYMDNPTRIAVDSEEKSTQNVNHVYYVANAKDKYLALKRIVDIHPNIYAIVFCRTRNLTKEIAEKLVNDGYNSDALHGDLSQAQRDHVMNKFRKKQIQLLVATDVAARGLDVNNLTHVINFNLPDEVEVYVHRSGRTGRADKVGTSVSIVHKRELSKIKLIEKKMNKSMELKQIPQGKEICEKQLFQLIDKVEKVEVNEDLIEKFLPAIYNKLSWLNREELIKHFVSVEFNRFLSYYEDAKDLNVDVKNADRSEKSSRNSKSDIKFTRFFINIGSKNKLTPKSLLNLINDNIPKRGVEVGDIEIMKGFSFFEVDKSFKNMIFEAFEDLQYKNINVAIEEAKPKQKNTSSRGEDFRPKKKRRKNMYNR